MTHARRVNDWPLYPAIRGNRTLSTPDCCPFRRVPVAGSGPGNECRVYTEFYPWESKNLIIVRFRSFFSARVVDWIRVPVMLVLDRGLGRGRWPKVVGFQLTTTSPYVL